MPLQDSFKKAIRSALHGRGLELVASNELTPARRAKMLQHNGIRTAIDVGANRGDFAGELRASGFQGRILSFEPVAATFALLAARAASDPAWDAFHAAVGAELGILEINVASQTGGSSSLLPMMPVHHENAPHIEVIGTEKIDVVTLESALAGKIEPGEPLLLKVDTQGYEANVLRGASSILPQVQLLECELSFVALYEGQPLFAQMMALIDSLGFEPVNFEPGFTAADSGYCLQVDGIFARKCS